MTDLHAKAPRRAGRPLAGMGWMLAAGLSFLAVQAIVKLLGREVPAAEAAFLRYFLALGFVLPMIGPMRRAGLTRGLLGIAVFRVAVHTLAVILWFYAMARIPIADVTAINYLVPVCVTIGAALFLGEKLAARRITAVIVALMGAVVILRPGFREITTGHATMLVSTLAFAASYLSAKRLTDSMSPLAVVGFLSLGVTLGLAPFAAAVWVTPTLAQVGWLFLVALFATAGHYAMTLAFAAAPIAVTQPVSFLQLVWASLLGIFVFDEATDVWVIVGGTIIIAAVSFISWREAVLKRRLLTPPAMAAKF